MRPAAKMSDGRSQSVGELPGRTTFPSYLSVMASDMVIAPVRSCATKAVVVPGLP